MSNRVSWVVGAVVLVGLWAPAAMAQGGLYIYPKNGQSKEQMSKDKGACMQWAVEESGFDPTQPDAPVAPPPQQQGADGSAVRGAAKGAAVGAIGGAIAGDAGKGAAVGAGVGGTVGVARKRSGARQADQQYQQQVSNQQADRAQNQANYNRAYSVCLEGKGYTVK